MSKTNGDFNFRQPVAYDEAVKRAFHNHTQHRLEQFAVSLGPAPGAYDLRTNQGGIAVSGEVNIIF